SPLWLPSRNGIASIWLCTLCAMSTARLYSSAALALPSAPENRRNTAVATSESTTNATSTSSSEKPRLVRGARHGSGRDDHTSGQPVDVDVELALARGEGHASAGGAAVGKEAHRPDVFRHEIL